MAFTPKDWRDATTYAGGGDISTPLTAASLEDMETRLAAYADSLVSPDVSQSALLYGFADDEDNHQDFSADALATGCNSARIGVGYNAPGSAASLAAVAAYEADPQIDQVVVYLWSVSVISSATWATQAALACTQYPNALIELINEPNLLSFGGYTYQQAADATIAAVNACPAGRIIGPAVSQIGESMGGDYLGYQAAMYDRIFDSVDPTEMAGVAFHLYPTTGDPGTEVEDHVTACYTAGLEQLPVFLTEIGFQYGIYGAYQPWSSANTFNTYYNDERLGGLFFYRLAPQQPTPIPGETFQQYPLTTNQPLDDALTEAFNAPPGGDPAPYAPLNSPTFTGSPRAPTPLPDDDGTRIATTQFAARMNRERLFRPEDAGAAADGVTDDTVALQEVIDASMAATASGRRAVTQLSVATYLCDTAPRTDREGHCILSVTDALDSQKSLTIRGINPAAAVDPAYLSDPLVGRSIIKTTETSAYSGSFGPPSVLGGATEEQGMSSTREYTGVIQLQDFVVQVPQNPSIGGIDAMSWGGLDALDVAVVAGATTTVQTNDEGFGWRLPSVWGNGAVRLKGCQAVQTYVGFVLHHADHHFYEAACAYYCRIGFAFQTGLTEFAYPLIGHYWMIEGCKYCIAGWTPGTGLASPDQEVFFAGMLVQTEVGGGNFTITNSVYDPDSKLRGRVDWHHWALDVIGTALPAISGGAKLDVRLPHAGHMTVNRYVPPADDDIDEAHTQFWMDPTTGEAMAKGKTGGAGTVRNYSLVGGSYPVYRTIFSAESFLVGGMVNGFPYAVGSVVSDESSTSVRVAVSSEALALNVDHQTASVVLPLHPVSVFPFDTADYAMVGGTIQLRLKVVVMSNGTDPATDLVVGLYKADSSGAANALSISPDGSVLSSVTLTNANLTASNPTTVTGSVFTATTGPVEFLVAPSGANTATGFAGSIHCYLQLAHTL